MPIKKKSETMKKAKEIEAKVSNEKVEEVKTENKISDKEKAKLIEVVKEKAKKLAEGLKEKKVEDMKEEITAAKRKRAEGTLFPLDDYVKYSAHLGTKAVTPHMREFVYRRRADGIAVLDTNRIDEKLKEAVEFLKDFEPEDIFLSCKREVGWEAVKKFSEITGIKVFTKKYPAGIITNIQLDDFFETKLVMICDPWLDKNALNDAIKIKLPVLALCDTNNLTNGVTKIVPCNNKAGKSLGLILYLMAREYLRLRKEENKAKELKDNFILLFIKKFLYLFGILG